MYLATWVMVK